jgi:NADH dehydrogenase [ubiquinone] 1 alpha subcomplex assembly factor 7
MVEASPALRDAQKELLCGKNKMKEIDIGYRCISQYANIPIIWTENIKDVPSGK